MDEASFYIIGTVASGPLWTATKSGKNILELRFAVRRQGANGNAYDDIIQVRFRRARTAKRSSPTSWATAWW